MADKLRDVLRADTKVLQAFLWLYEVWEGAFLEERFMDTELKSLDLPCNVDDFCKIQVRGFRRPLAKSDGKAMSYVGLSLTL